MLGWRRGIRDLVHGTAGEPIIRPADICRGFGDHLQLIVFRADLSPRARAELIAALDAVINHKEDQVLLVAAGPTKGTKVTRSFSALGRPYTHPERHAVII